MRNLNILTTRKKQAIASLCLTAFCSEYNIKHELILQLSRHLLCVLRTTNLPEWNSQTLNLEPTKLNIEDIKKAIPETIASSIFLDLLNGVLEVGWSNMYTVKSDKPIFELNKVIQILQDANVAVPILDEEFYSIGNEDFDGTGWGKPLESNEFQKVITLFEKMNSRDRQSPIRL